MAQYLCITKCQYNSSVWKPGDVMETEDEVTCPHFKPLGWRKAEEVLKENPEAQKAVEDAQKVMGPRDPVSLSDIAKSEEPRPIKKRERRVKAT